MMPNSLVLLIKVSQFSQRLFDAGKLLLFYRKENVAQYQEA